MGSTTGMALYSLVDITPKPILTDASHVIMWSTYDGLVGFTELHGLTKPDGWSSRQSLRTKRWPYHWQDTWSCGMIDLQN